MRTTEINTIDDLVASGSFRKWILEKDENEAIVWNQWIEENPSRIEWVATAKVIVTLLTDESSNFLPDEEVDAEAVAIQRRIGDSGRPALLRYSWIAASVLIVVAGVFLLRKNTGPASPGYAYESFLQNTRNKNIEYNNGTDSVQRILLSDGSEVLLEKDSRLSYAPDFSTGKREIYLTGNAFFTVARDPTRPFIVYTQRIIARVLGTSFRVDARDSEKTARVVVRTGKVSVFSRENFTPADLDSGTASGPGALNGIVLTPNQEVIYDRTNQQMSKTLAEEPVVTKDSISSFVFDDTPATAVFRKLQEAYGITILLDEETIASCSISASLGNEPFYEKLNMICRIINAHYQVIDGNVVINAKGCRKEDGKPN